MQSDCLQVLRQRLEWTHSGLMLERRNAFSGSLRPHNKLHPPYAQQARSSIPHKQAPSSIPLFVSSTSSSSRVSPSRQELFVCTTHKDTHISSSAFSCPSLPSSSSDSPLGRQQ